MLNKPSAHVLIGPSPFKRMGIEFVIFRPSRFDVVDQFLAAVPRATLQIVEAKGIVEQFRLIEPGGVHRCEARSPPRLLLEVVFGSCCGMAGIAILNQKHTAQVPMVLSKLMQRLDVMVSVFIRRAGRFHATAVHDQKQQYVDRAMAYVLELLLFNRAGNRPADRLALNGLKIRHLVDADDPEAAA